MDAGIALGNFEYTSTCLKNFTNGNLSLGLVYNQVTQDTQVFKKYLHSIP